ncbi:unnamed protein product [Ilex paraguariensis]|uniref:Terpene synthase N-terminal domain-containing protein n=1 Tax=Ilex paraguariensis TaxID=185542 RepID=A0ABC8SKW7_9AQUA
MMIEKATEPLDQLELIDNLQRLGVSYHFEDEIKRILENIYSNNKWQKEDLYAAALRFRLLRQHGYDVPQVVGESILERAREFTTKLLKEKLDEQKMDQNVDVLVHHALKLPLHWRMLRLEARWFIDLYEKRPDMNLVLLEFVKLDFNIVQATHQSDLRFVSK